MREAYELLADPPLYDGLQPRRLRRHDVSDGGRAVGARYCLQRCGDVKPYLVLEVARGGGEGAVTAHHSRSPAVGSPSHWASRSGARPRCGPARARAPHRRRPGRRRLGAARRLPGRRPAPLRTGGHRGVRCRLRWRLEPRPGLASPCSTLGVDLASSASMSRVTPNSCRASPRAASWPRRTSRASRTASRADADDGACRDAQRDEHHDVIQLQAARRRSS